MGRRRPGFKIHLITRRKYVMSKQSLAPHYIKLSSQFCDEAEKINYCALQFVQEQSDLHLFDLINFGRTTSQTIVFLLF